ncbi:MAG: hypothetical protein H6Q15_1312 [Bacteroidetes bacterium]|nr:hypothetical protein [Bacteroidota bacterium]
MITKDNYEAYFLDAIEGNLSMDELRDLNKFLAENPELRKELEAYDKDFILIPENISFSEKNSLKHKYLFLFPSWAKYSSVAAVALIFLILASQLFFKSEKETSTIKQQPIASNTNIIGRVIKEIENISTRNKRTKKEQQKENKQAKQTVQEKQVASTIITTQTQESTQTQDTIYSNSLVIYEVENLITYNDDKEESIVNSAIVVQGSSQAVSQESKHVNFTNRIINKFKSRIETRIDETKEDFNSVIDDFNGGIKLYASNIGIKSK